MNLRKTRRGTFRGWWSREGPRRGRRPWGRASRGREIRGGTFRRQGPERGTVDGGRTGVRPSWGIIWSWGPSLEVGQMWSYVSGYLPNGCPWPVEAISWLKVLLSKTMLFSYFSILLLSHYGLIKSLIIYATKNISMEHVWFKNQCNWIFLSYLDANVHDLWMIWTMWCVADMMYMKYVMKWPDHMSVVRLIWLKNLR